MVERYGPPDMRVVRKGDYAGRTYAAFHRVHPGVDPEWWHIPEYVRRCRL